MQTKISYGHEIIQGDPPEQDVVSVQNCTLSRWTSSIQASEISTTELFSVKNLDDTYSSSTSYLDTNSEIDSTAQFSPGMEESMITCQSVLPNLGIDKLLLFQNGKAIYSLNNYSGDLMSIDYSDDTMLTPDSTIFSSSFNTDDSTTSNSNENISSMSNIATYTNEVQMNNSFYNQSTFNETKKFDVGPIQSIENQTIESSDGSQNLHLIMTDDGKYETIEDCCIETQAVEFLISDGQPGMSYSVSNENGFIIARPTSMCSLPKRDILEEVSSMDIAMLDSLEDVSDIKYEINGNGNVEKRDVNGNLSIMDTESENTIISSISQIHNDDKVDKSLVHIMDKSVPVRAFASLPGSYLSIKLDEQGQPCGVLSCKLILPKVRFGPLEGVKSPISIESTMKYPNPCFLIHIRENILRVDVSDEQTSNWMRFVRFEPGPRQNIVIEQIDRELYFITSSIITSGSELILGYGDSYQSKWSFTFPKEIKNEDNFTWSCCKCMKEFSSSFELDVHLNEHKEKDSQVDFNTHVDGISQQSFFNDKSLENSNSIDLVKDELNNKSIDESSEATPIELSEMILKNADSLEETYIVQTNAPTKQFLCKLCQNISNGIDEFINHVETHFDDTNKQCPLCSKCLKDLPELRIHIQSHDDIFNNFKCVLCSATFLRQYELSHHTKSIHRRQDGKFDCPNCEPLRTFLDYNAIKKHMKALHESKTFVCGNCDCKFSSSDRLQMHSLKHSDVKNIECPICKKQFKRKDKLTAHLKHPHPPPKNEMEKSTSENGSSNHQPLKTMSYTKYTFKCHTCRSGFKRRGMLVNHFARCHPEISRASVPELQLPILKTTRDYYCQHCDKVYKSSSKRKAHIIKNHPGESIPPSSRGIDLGAGEYGKVGGVGYTACVGTVSVTPHHCPHDPCHKQYASKAKLLQHIRSKHPLQTNNTKENGDELAPDTFMISDEQYVSSTTQEKVKFAENVLPVDGNEKTSILKTKLINMSIEKSARKNEMFETNGKFYLKKGNSSIMEANKLVHVTGHILSFNKKLPPVSVLTSNTAEIPLHSQYTDR